MSHAMQLADELGRIGDGKEQFRCLRILMGKPMFGSGKMPSKDDEGKAFGSAQELADFMARFAERKLGTGGAV